MALSAILFGTRHAEATEHQNGMMLSVAAEAVVKLAAFLVVGTNIQTLTYESPHALIVESLIDHAGDVAFEREGQHAHDRIAEQPGHQVKPDHKEEPGDK